MISDNEPDVNISGIFFGILECGSLIAYGMVLRAGGETPGTTSVSGVLVVRLRGTKGTVGLSKSWSAWLPMIARMGRTMTNRCPNF